MMAVAQLARAYFSSLCQGWKINVYRTVQLPLNGDLELIWYLRHYLLRSRGVARAGRGRAWLSLRGGELEMLQSLLLL